MKRLPVKGFEDAYEVSENGEIYSIERQVFGGDGIFYPFPAKHKAKHLNKNGYYTVSLYRGNIGYTQYVHRIVASAFLREIPGKYEVNHKDGQKTNNVKTNLEWVDSQENSIHAVKTGLHTYTNRLTETEFLACLQEVIAGESYAALSERVPYQVPFLSTKLRKIAQKYGLEEQLNDSLMLQRQRRARINGAKSYR